MDDTTVLKAINEQIGRIYNEALRVVENSNLTVEAKIQSLDLKIERTKILCEQKLQLGWVNQGNLNIPLIEITVLKNNLAQNEDKSKDQPSSEDAKTKQELCWYNKKKGEYQFGGKIFKQGGEIRKKVFVAMMDIYDKTKSEISVASIKEITHMTPERIRIDIAAIKKRLSKVGYSFKASGRGYYTLEVYISL